MHPVLSIGIYVIMELLTLLFAAACLKDNVCLPKGSRMLRTVYAASAAVFLLLGMTPVLGAMLPDRSVKFTLQAAGNIWLGFFIYFGGLLLILFILVCILDLIRHKKERGRLRLGIFAVSLLTGIVLLLYGMAHAQNTVLTSYEISSQKETGERKDLKVVLIADLHLSVNSNIPLIRRMVDTINDQDADVVLIGGDIFTSSYRSLKHPEKYAAILREIKAGDGVYAVYGNHDVEEGLFGGFPVTPISKAFRSKEMEQFFEDSGFTVLYDETVTVADGAVQITGRIDGEKAGDGTTNRKNPSEVLAGIDPEKYSIVLQHEPVEFAKLKESGADLVLCGHTHAGQIFPGNLFTRFFNENAYGYKIIAGLDTVVTAGIGYYGPPMRVGTNSEITVINLHLS